MSQKKYTLYEMRQKSNKSGTLVAELCGVSYKSLRNWESHTTVPNIVNLKDLLDIYGFTFDELDMSEFYDVKDNRIKKQQSDIEKEPNPHKQRINLKRTRTKKHQQ